MCRLLFLCVDFICICFYQLTRIFYFYYFVYFVYLFYICILKIVLQFLCIYDMLTVCVIEKERDNSDFVINV